MYNRTEGVTDVICMVFNIGVLHRNKYFQFLFTQCFGNLLLPHGEKFHRIPRTIILLFLLVREEETVFFLRRGKIWLLFCSVHL